MLLLLTAGVFTLLLYWWWKQDGNNKRNNFPPGPTVWFPILGHLPWLGKYPHKTLLKWRDTYGPVVGLWFGNYRAIAVSDAALVKELMSSSSILGRPRMNFFVEWGGGALKGIAVSDGPHWVEQRKFAVKEMKSYGFGSHSHESKIQDHILEVVEHLKKEAADGPIRMESKFELAAAKVVWSFLMHEDEAREKTNDTVLEDALRNIARVLIESSSSVSVSMFLPWLTKIAPGLTGMGSMRKRFRLVREFIQGRVEAHSRARPDDSDPPRDFVDAYMDRVAQTKDPNSSFHSNQNTIVITLQDFLIGGSETVNTTLNWLFAYMVRWPGIQAKLQEEIDQVVGHERFPSLSDRAQMPYTLALIYETLRFSSVGPLGSRRATEDLNFHGYHIPEGTFILPNFYAAHYDQSVWGDPGTFRPSRFLDPSGKCLGKSEYLFAFSGGKRACPGEALAWDELFLFTTHLFQEFEARVVGELPALNGVLGVTLSVKPFDIILTSRRS